MSKIIVAVIVLAVTVAVQGCDDSCQGKPDGVGFPSDCGPRARYYDCKGDTINYRYCGNHQCLLPGPGGACGGCQDSCYWKPDGDYESFDNPRPFYYHCENGFLSYRLCHPNERFNPWVGECECYETFCEKGDGYQPSVCGNGGCRRYVKCDGGYPVLRRQCPPARPYFCCHKQVCCESAAVCGGDSCGY